MAKFEVAQAQKSPSESVYIVTSTTGAQVAAGYDSFQNEEDFVAQIKSGKVGDTCGQALELMQALIGPTVEEGLKAAVAELTDLSTVYTNKA